MQRLGGPTNDRLILHTVAHEGGMMIDWQPAADDYPGTAGWQAEIESTGAMVIRFNRPSDDLPMALVIGGPEAQVMIYATEDGVSDMAPGTPVLFNSETVEDPL